MTKCNDNIWTTIKYFIGKMFKHKWTRRAFVASIAITLPLVSIVAILKYL